MSKSIRRDPVSGVSAARSAGSATFLLVAVIILIVLFASLFWLFVDFGNEDAKDAPLLATVTRGQFQRIVLANGEVESSSSVDVKCQVRVRAGTTGTGSATTILEVIPEGTLVQEGDWLATLDSSGLEQEKLAEQIVLNTMEADMIRAKAAFDSAKFDKDELETRGIERIKINLGATSRTTAGTSPTKGASAGNSTEADSSPAPRKPSPPSSDETSAESSSDSQPAADENRPAPLVDPTYGEQKRFIENELSLADTSLKKARLSFESTQRRVARGQVPRIQLESERFRLEAARNVKDLAEQKLVTLKKHTRQKLLVQLQANFEAAGARYRSAQRSYEEQRSKVEAIDSQIVMCRMVAPAAGQVVYKNVQSRRENRSFVVEPGAPVRQNQVIIMLPDPAQMQVKTRVDESRVNLLQPGMSATVRIDAFGSVLRGEIIKVNEFAEATSSWVSVRSKQYLTLIRLMDFPSGVRVGLSAEVRMLVEERADALKIPFQAVYEHQGKAFCLIEGDDSWETKEIVISSTNEKLVVLDETASESVQEGDRVVMNPLKHLDLFDSTRLSQEESSQDQSAAPQS